MINEIKNFENNLYNNNRQLTVDYINKKKTHNIMLYLSYYIIFCIV